MPGLVVKRLDIILALGKDFTVHSPALDFF
jgi:hypothetical protein